MTEEISPEVIKKTQDSLGKYIKRPPLTEKLLKKPPFRFLHDITTSIINETGFLNGLYDSNEMQSENIKDRDAKIAFLQKLIDTLKLITNETISARPSKIVAGLEPAKTNQLLQIMGRSIDKKLDSTKAVQQVTGTPITSERKSSKTKIDSKSKSKTSIEAKKLVRKNTEEKINITKKKASPRNEKENNAEEKISITKKKPSPRNEKENNKTEKNDRVKKQNSVEKENSETKIRKISREREKSIIKESKKIPELNSNTNVEDILSPKSETTQSQENEILSIENTVPEQLKETTDENLKTESSEKQIENQEKSEIPKEIIESKKPDLPKLETVETLELKPDLSKAVPIELKSDLTKTEHKTEIMATRKQSARLRPPSVRPSSARPAAPRLREKSDTIVPPEQLIPMGKVHVIVEQAQTNDDNEETVNIEIPTEEVQNEPIISQEIPAERGHLVQQILEQIGDQTPTHKPKIIENKIDDKKLTQSIQTLTRAANPLGKLVSYIHEDVDSMLSELRSWIGVNKRLKEQVTEEKKRSLESVRPLLQQLEKLDSDIERQRNMIHSTQANVLRNQQKIKQLLIRD